MPGGSASSYSQPLPVERRQGPVAAVYESSVNQDVLPGATLLVSLDTQIYDAPFYAQPPAPPGVLQEPDTTPYVTNTSPWSFIAPFYSGYAIELFGVVGGDGGPVDIYYFVNFVAYIWQFSVTGPFALTKHLVLNKDDILEFFIAAPGATGATLIDLKGTAMLVSIGTG